jgi:hypothetical protein
MLESPEELAALQDLLDSSMAAAGPHLAGIMTEDRRLSAVQLSRRLPGMCLFTVATVTADGRPIAGVVDGYFLHGHVYFSTSPASVRAKHLAARPAVSATHVPGEQLAVTVHGHAEVFVLHSPEGDELRQAMLDHYLPLQGESFKEWLDGLTDGIGVRISADKMFTCAV